MKQEIGRCKCDVTRKKICALVKNNNFFGGKPAIHAFLPWKDG